MNPITKLPVTFASPSEANSWNQPIDLIEVSAILQARALARFKSRKPAARRHTQASAWPRRTGHTRSQHRFASPRFHALNHTLEGLLP